MFEIMALLIVGYVVLMPLIAFGKARALQELTERNVALLMTLRQEVDALKAARATTHPPEEAGPDVAEASPDAAEAGPWAKTSPHDALHATPAASVGEPGAADQDAPGQQDQSPQPPLSRRFKDWELRLGGNWSMWIGAAALAVGGILLVRYLVDIGWFSDVARVALETLAGVALIAVAQWLAATGRAKPLAMFPDASVAAAVATGGVVTLYATAYTAQAWHGLIGVQTCFTIMALVSMASVGLAILHGVMLALVGLAGAYAVPMLVDSPDPSAMGLFAYLAVVGMVAQAVTRKGRWPYLRTLPVAASAVWIPVWHFFGPWERGDGAIMVAYMAVLMAVDLLIDWRRARPQDAAIAADDGDDANDGDVLTTVRLGSWSLPLTWPRIVTGAWVLVGAVYGFSEPRADYYNWAALGAALALAALALALLRRDEALVGLAVLPVASIGGLLLMWGVSLASWVPFHDLDRAQPPVGLYPWAVVAAAAAFAALGYALRVRSARPGVWTGVAALAPVTFVAAGHGHALVTLEATPWWMFALGLAVLNAAAAWAWKANREDAGTTVAAHVLGALGALALLAGMLGNEVWFMMALGLALPAIAVVRRWVPEPGLDAAGLVVTLYILVRYVAEPGLISDLRAGWAEALWVLPGYGVPGIAMAVAAWMSAARNGGTLARVQWGGALVCVLLAVMAAVKVVQFGAPGPLDVQFLHRAMQAAAALGMAYALYRGERDDSSPVLSWTWKVLAACGGVYVLMGHGVLINPLFRHIAIGSAPLLSPLLVAFGAPGLIAVLFARQARARGDWMLMAAASTVGGLLLFGYMNLEIRHVFAGPYLDVWPMPSAEIYTYSVLWVAFAAGMIAYGFVRDLVSVRKVALALLALTVVKVFLVDLSGVAGLYRAVLFLGVGGVLMAVSYAYQRLARGGGGV